MAAERAALPRDRVRAQRIGGARSSRLVERCRGARRLLQSDRDGYAARFDLDAEERAALVALDRDALRDRFAINPMLLYQLEARVKS